MISMKTISIVKSSMMAASLLAIFTISCKKDNNNKTEDPEMQNAIAASSDNDIASSQFSDVMSISLGVQEADAGESIGLGTGAGTIYRPGGNETTLGDHCFTVTVSPKVPGEWPKKATFDFGDGCKGTDGKVRKGKIYVVFTNPAYMPGAKITTTFDGYSVDSFDIAGQQVIENTSSGDKLGLSVTITDGRLTNTNTGFWHSLAGKHTWTLKSGLATPLNFLDDVYEVTGSVNGGNSTGFTWTSEITKPLIRKFTCRYRVQGTLSIHWNQNPDAATLDYGKDDDCDALATLSYKGFSKVISLR